MAKTAPATHLYRSRHGTRRIACLLGEVGHGLDARVGQHRHRDGDRKLRPRRGHAPVDVVLNHLGAEHENEADDHEQHLRGEVENREGHAQLGRFLDADDVERGQHDDHDRPDDDVSGVLLERLPEDREIVRHEERGRGDGDDVDEQLRPRGAEAHELVVCVAREARRPARLRVTHRAFCIRGGGRGEDDPGEDEDERGQAERIDGRQAERVVDGRADVAVRGREQRRGPEHALETVLSPAASPRRRSSFYGRHVSHSRAPTLPPAP